MIVALNGATVDAGPVAPSVLAPRAQASLLSGLSRAAPSAVTRLQLPSAVAASTTIAHLPSHAAPAPKPLQRNASSLLAAQFIAQNITFTASDLEIFAVQKNRAQLIVPQVHGDDDLAGLRVARGDVPEAKQAKASASMSPAQEIIETATRDALVAAKAAPALAQTSLRSGLGSFATSLPPLALPLLRRVNIATIKGVRAYAFALARNATLRAPAEQAS